MAGVGEPGDLVDAALVARPGVHLLLGDETLVFTWLEGAGGVQVRSTLVIVELLAMKLEQVCKGEIKESVCECIYFCEYISYI